MSRIARSARIAVVVIGVMTTIANAQSAPQSATLASRQRAAAIARVELDSAMSLLRADSLQRAGRSIIRTYAGLVIRSDTTKYIPSFLRDLDRAFARAIVSGRRFFGTATDTLLNGLEISILERYESPEAERGGEPARHVSIIGPMSRHWTTSNTSGTNPEQLELLLTDWMSIRAGERIPPAIARWQQDRVNAYPQSSLVAGRLAYVQLASGRFPMSRACLDGSLSACRSALAIVPKNDTIGAWFNAAARRSYVRSVAIREPRRGGIDLRELRRTCVEQGVDSACRAMINDIRVASPTTREPRQELLRRALERGGPEAYARLIASRSDDDIAAILERVAGIPLDSLISEWREATIAVRSPSPVPNAGELAAGLVLTALMIGVSARRRP